MASVSFLPSLLLEITLISPLTDCDKASKIGQPHSNYKNQKRVSKLWIPVLWALQYLLLVIDFYLLLMTDFLFIIRIKKRTSPVR